MLKAIIKAQYHLAGLPTSWIGKELDVSKPRMVKLMKALDNLPEDPISLVVTGDIAPLVNYLLSDSIGALVTGINYTEYFDSKLGKSDTRITANFSGFVAIYNVGYEPVNNYSYTSKLLKQLIHNIKDKGHHVLIQTPMSKSEFERCYEINVVNHINIPQEQEEKII